MNPQRSSTVYSGDVQLAVREYGVDHPLTLVLVHGYPDSSEVWQRMLEPLSRHYHVVTYDVRGCGQSSVPGRRDDYRLEWLAQDFRAVIDAVSPDQPVHLLAHDWGSIQSWEAVTEPSMQARIKSFTTVSGPSLDHVGHWARERLKSFSPTEWKTVGGQLAHSWYIGMFQLPLLAPTVWKLALGKRWHEVLEEREGVKAHASPTQLKDGVNGIELYRANIKRVVLPRKRSTTVPVQQIVLLRDDFASPAMVRDSIRPWVQHLWSRDLDATHWAPLSHPEDLAAMALEFIGSIEGETKRA